MTVDVKNKSFDLQFDTMNGNRDFTSNVGRNLQLLRKQYHLTQAQLAEKLEVSVSHIANIEREETSISLSLVEKIIDLFGITPNDLLLEKTSENSEENSPQEKLKQIIRSNFEF
ncbi:MAG: helix-turn-helix domain-containing protein [Treponema sp.]